MEKRVVVVTGAGGNIGSAIVRRFVDGGYSVVAQDMSGESLDKLQSVYPDVVPFVGDVRSPDDNRALVDAALQRFGALQVAVLNAGTAGGPGIEDAGAYSRFQEVMSTNVEGVFLGMQAAIPAIRASGGGAIVAMGSVEGLGGSAGLYAYNASKAAIINLVRAVAIDYATRGVRVNAVCPGPIEPPHDRVLSDAAREAHRLAASFVPMQREGTAAEVAEATYFLASDAASFITGEALSVDGGVNGSSGSFPPPKMSDATPSGFAGASMSG